MDVDGSQFLLEQSGLNFFQQTGSLESELQLRQLREQVKRGNQAIADLEQRNLVLQKSLNFLLKNVLEIPEA